MVVVDDEDRENEGDIIFAAAKATPEMMAKIGLASDSNSVSTPKSPLPCAPYQTRRMRTVSVAAWTS